MNKYFLRFFVTLISFTCLGTSTMALAEPVHSSKDSVALALESENLNTRQQAAQQITNNGLMVPLQHPKRKQAAQQIFNTWQQETDAQTQTRMQQMIFALGFRIQYFTRRETTTGEKPEYVTDQRLLGPFAPKQPANSTNSTTAVPPRPPNLPKPKSAEASKPTDPPQQPRNTRRIYRAPVPLSSTDMVGPVTESVLRNSRQPPIPYLPRMNGLFDNRSGSLDTDITKTCQLNSRCLRACPVGAHCIPCEAGEREHLAEMRKLMRDNPNVVEPQTTGLLNVIPLLIKIIQGADLEEILEPNL